MWERWSWWISFPAAIQEKARYVYMQWVRGLDVVIKYISVSFINPEHNENKHFFAFWIWWRSYLKMWVVFPNSDGSVEHHFPHTNGRTRFFFFCLFVLRVMISLSGANRCSERGLLRKPSNANHSSSCWETHAKPADKSGLRHSIYRTWT